MAPAREIRNLIDRNWRSQRPFVDCEVWAGRRARRRSFRYVGRIRVDPDPRFSKYPSLGTGFAIDPSRSCKAFAAEMLAGMVKDSLLEPENADGHVRLGIRDSRGSY